MENKTITFLDLPYLEDLTDLTESLHFITKLTEQNEPEKIQGWVDKLLGSLNKKNIYCN